ncbi:MAG: hypothetical protein EU541_02720 [Promethearchaeota archaeon]|nr:MAG: hypothetical protein EU541_02720 [Candidatus Lokiarchaeota archaeon]
MKYQKRNQFDVTFETYKTIQNKLDLCKNSLKDKRVFLAIDGFIDSLYSAVKTRRDLDDWNNFNTIKAFAERIISFAGSSGNIELILKKQTSGGFVPNNAKALNALEINLFLLGALGHPNIKQSFEELNKNKSIKIKSITNPGKTYGLEFNDGKVMLSDLENLYKIKWENLIQIISEEEIIKEMEGSDIIGFGYWAIIPEMTDIWTQLLNRILPSIKTANKKIFFIDLADVKKRESKDILEMLKILQKIDESIPVLLSLNDQEAIDLSKTLEDVKRINPNKKSFEDFIDAGRRINKNLGLSYLIIHSPHFATCTLKNIEKHYWVTEGFTKEPSYTVSAGDHFNSGMLGGLLCNLSPPEALLMGNALTAIFVRTGISPDFIQLKKFINNYMTYIYDDLPTLI